MMGAFGREIESRVVYFEYVHIPSPMHKMFGEGKCGFNFVRFYQKSMLFALDVSQMMNKKVLPCTE